MQLEVTGYSMEFQMVSVILPSVPSASVSLIQPQHEGHLDHFKEGLPQIKTLMKRPETLFFSAVFKSVFGCVFISSAISSGHM